MKKLGSYAVFGFFVCLLIISGIGCHLILPFSPKNEPATNSYYCVGTIYRELPGGKEFTETYTTDIWPGDMDDNKIIDENDAKLLCNYKAMDYIDEYMAKGFIFDWKRRPFTVYPNPPQMNGADCSDVAPYPPIYGGSWGSAVSWQDPDGEGPGEIPTSEASVLIRITKDGTDYSAEPKVNDALIRLAERTGLPDASGNYVRGVRHVRISHMSIELKPFSIAGLDVKELRIHNIGTVATDGYGTHATIKPNTLKLYMYGRGEKDGNSGTTSQCVLNDQGTGISYTVYPTYFVFTLDTTFNVGGLPLYVKISLVSPSEKKFNMHQPHVSLPIPSNWERTSPVNLTPFFSFDGDNDLWKFLWFENFEDPSSEIFLGEGETLPNVDFSPGDHEITVVAYDTQGAYNTATSTLKIVANVAPVATDNSYTVPEDTILAIGPPGVLGNDSDANSDLMTALLVSGATNGTVTLNPAGSFIYTPKGNFFGTDSFKYKANDGKLDSNEATVTITVTPVNDPPVAANDTYSVDEDSTLTVPAPGVLGNDKDPVENDPLTAIKVNGPANGSLTLNSNGSFTYTPKTDYSGSDSFTYTANDGAADSNIATVTINVNYLSPDQEIEKQLKEMVNDLMEAGALNQGQGNGLLSKLDVAIGKIKAGQKTVGCNLLTAFINEVTSLISDGVLTQTQGQPLIDKAMNVKGESGCK